MKRIGMRYTRRDCVKLCEQKLIIEHNKCYSLDYPKIFDFPPCPNPVELSFNMTDCVDQCPHECSSTTYDLSISYGEFPSRIYMENLMRRDQTGLYRWAFQAYQDGNSSGYQIDSLVLARASLVKIFIYFEDIKYTRISEAPTITFVDLIANIGGTLGLFIGISLLSFVELIELIFDIVVIVWVSYKTKRQARISIQESGIETAK